MRLILIQGFNNYFNRKIIKYDNRNDYTSNRSFEEYPNIDFNPNDGTNTTQIINTYININPDYCLVLDENTGNIVSRWFVLESVRTRGGQYQLSLRRDVVADHFNEIIGAPCFVERGPLAPTNKLIYNSEGMSFNQIKMNEIPLKDETNNAWIVGYLDRSADMPTDEIVSYFNSDQYLTPESMGIQMVDPSDPSMGGTIKSVATDDLVVRHHFFYAGYSTNYSRAIGFHITRNGAMLDTLPNSIVNYSLQGPLGGYYGHLKVGWSTSQDNTIANTVAGYWKAAATGASASRTTIALGFTSYINNRGYATQENYNKVSVNPIIKIGVKYYSVKVLNTENVEVSVPVVNSGDTTSMYTAFTSLHTRMINAGTGDNLTQLSDFKDPAYSVMFTRGTKTLSFEEVVPPGVSKTTLKPVGERNSLDDAPYDMFCLKYNLSNLALAQAIAKNLGVSSGGNSGFLIDLQILPYCPARFIMDGSALNPSDYSDVTQRQELTTHDIVVDKIYYCKHSSDTFTITMPLTMPIRTSDEATNIKLANEIDVYRLTSPNYASTFEFNLAKNGDINT